MIDYILSPQSIEALGWTLLHSLWQGAGFAILLVLILIALRSYTAQSRYVVSVGLLCAFFLTVSATFWQQWQASNDRSALYEMQLNDLSSEGRFIISDAIKNGLPAEGESIIMTSNKKSTSLFDQSGWLMTFRNYYDRHLPLLVTIWFVGILFLQLRFLGQLAYVQRLKHYGTRLFPTAWGDRIEELEGKLRIQKKVRYLTSLRIESPMVIGWLKPVVLMPQQLFSSLSESEIYTVLAHELAHIRREDFVINLMQTFLCNVFFFHPGVWWMSHRIDDEREHCCDDIAVAATGPATSYAKTLINVSALQLRMQGNTTLAMALSGKSKRRERGGFSGRIKRLFSVNNGTGAFREGFATACILIAALCLGIVATGSTVLDNDRIDSLENDVAEVSTDDNSKLLSDLNQTKDAEQLPVTNPQKPEDPENIALTESNIVTTTIKEQAAIIIPNDTRIDALVMACAEGDLDFVRTLVDSGIDVNGVGSEGFTPLMMAASEDESDIVKYLIDQGADVSRTFDGWSALIESADEGSVKSMKYLLEAGANVNYYGEQEGRTAISMAASEGHLECLKLLIAKGADINGIGVSMPPLHAAAEEGKRGVVDYLIFQKVNLNKKDASSRTALMYAASEGQGSIVKKLVEAGADILIVDTDGASARDHAIEEDQHSIRDYLRKEKIPSIHLAIQNGHLEKAQGMVEQGTAVDSRDDSGRTPLHIAAALDHDIDMRGLINLGADINAKDKQGRTPMMYAAADGNRGAVALLVSLMANVDLKDDDGMNALNWAHTGGNTDLVNFLGLITKDKTYPSDVDSRSHKQRIKDQQEREKSRQKRIQNNESRRIKRENKYQKEQVKSRQKRIESNVQNEYHSDVYTDHYRDVKTDVHTDVHTYTHTDIHTDVHTDDRTGHHIDIFTDTIQDDPRREYLHVTEGGYPLRQFDIKEKIPHLLEVVRDGTITECADLLKNGLSVNATDDTGQTPLMVATMKGRLDMTRFLIERGADVNQSSDAGLTALHYAALENHDQIARLLLDNNASVDPTMSYSSTDGNYKKEPYVWEYIGATPLLIAVEAGNVDVVSVLIDAGANKDHTLTRNEYRLNKDRVSYLSGSEVMGLNKDFLKEVEFKNRDDSWTPYKQALLLNEPSILVYFPKN